MTVLITGGAGFIGSNFAHRWLSMSSETIINLDKLTYAGNLNNLSSLRDNPAHHFVKGGIADRTLVGALLREHSPRAVLNFAAESHVDRSIHGPEDFVQTNVMGTYALLEEIRSYWIHLPEAKAKTFRFLHVSTDEVYGTLTPDDPPFAEENPYRPNSPYSATKAASDHLVRAWYHTYGLPVLTTNCSNNYGPYQFPEKLIPLVIYKALGGEPLPIYGDGMQIRDWLYVVDHCDAIVRVMENGNTGQTYNIGGNNEVTNIDVVRAICEILDRLRPRPSTGSYTDLITHIKDRPGHDRRYAINAKKISGELNWQPRETFHTGLTKTVQWYLDNQEWVKSVTSGAYRNWVSKQYEK